MYILFGRGERSRSLTSTTKGDIYVHTSEQADCHSSRRNSRRCRFSHDSRKANAQSGDLTVTIGAPLPVPVSIAGSSTISGTVGLAPGASVRIDNTVTNPVPVSNVNDAIQPFQPSNICFGPSGSGGCTVTIFTVPAGKRAVVEYFNGFASFTNAGGQVASVGLRTTVAGLVGFNNLPPTPPAVSNLNGPGAGGGTTGSSVRGFRNNDRGHWYTQHHGELL
jgi:hypothetical protein